MELAIDPCGMIVDWLVSLSSRPVWFYFAEPLQPPPAADLRNYAMGLGRPDNPTARKQVMVRWYWAPLGAKPLPYETCYRSTLALSELEIGSQLIGEIPRYTKTFTDGHYCDGTADPRWTRSILPLGATGQQACGAPELWNDALNGAPLLPRGPGGLPICCNPALGAAMGMGAFAYPAPTPTPARTALVMAGLELPELPQAPMAMAGLTIAQGKPALALNGKPAALDGTGMGFENPAAAAALAMAGIDVAAEASLVLSGPPLLTVAIGAADLVASAAELDGAGQEGAQGDGDLQASAAELQASAQAGNVGIGDLIAVHGEMAGSGQSGDQGSSALKTTHAVMSAAGTFSTSSTPTCTSCHPPLSTLVLHYPANMYLGNSAGTTNLTYNSKAGEWDGALLGQFCWLACGRTYPNGWQFHFYNVSVADCQLFGACPPLTGTVPSVANWNGTGNTMNGGAISITW